MNGSSVGPKGEILALRGAELAAAEEYLRAVTDAGDARGPSFPEVSFDSMTGVAAVVIPFLRSVEQVLGDLRGEAGDLTAGLRDIQARAGEQDKRLAGLFRQPAGGALSRL